MKDFIDIKDVEVNNMKKKELLEANGGYADPIIYTPGTPSGALPPSPAEITIRFPFHWGNLIWW